MKRTVLALAAAMVLHAEEATDLSALRLGKQVLGRAVSVEGLRGKAVMLDFWGTR